MTAALRLYVLVEPSPDGMISREATIEEARTFIAARELLDDAGIRAVRQIAVEQGAIPAVERIRRITGCGLAEAFAYLRADPIMNTAHGSVRRIYIMHALVGDGTGEPPWGDQARNVARYVRFLAAATNDPRGQGAVVLSWLHHVRLHDEGRTPPAGYMGELAGFYLRRDRELIRVSTEGWLCSPPEASSGVRYELGVFAEFGIPVVKKPEWIDPDYWPGRGAL